MKCGKNEAEQYVYDELKEAVQRLREENTALNKLIRHLEERDSHQAKDAVKQTLVHKNENNAIKLSE